MHTIAPGLGYVDLDFLAHSRIIATTVLTGADGVALVDPGPSTCLPTLETRLAAHGASVADLRALLLTHIHLDHAGATGSLVRKNPRIEVYVHERGARHMADPARLLESARRLYGDDMDRLWGEFLAVPAANIRSLAGGERLTIGARRLEVAYTPGHASHHVSFFDSASGVAFVGDTAGIRIGPTLYVMPPTPPPDVDLEIWPASVAAIEAWRPETLFATHFGPHGRATPHLQTLLATLEEFAGMVRASLDQPGTDEERVAWFTTEVGRHLRRHLPEADATCYERAAPAWQCWLGLARYWRKKLGTGR